MCLYFSGPVKKKSFPTDLNLEWASPLNKSCCITKLKKKKIGYEFVFISPLSNRREFQAKSAMFLQEFGSFIDFRVAVISWAGCSTDAGLTFGCSPACYLVSPPQCKGALGQGSIFFIYLVQVLLWCLAWSKLLNKYLLNERTNPYSRYLLLHSLEDCHIN